MTPTLVSENVSAAAEALDDPPTGSSSIGISIFPSPKKQRVDFTLQNIQPSIFGELPSAGEGSPDQRSKPDADPPSSPQSNFTTVDLSTISDVSISHSIESERYFGPESTTASSPPWGPQPPSSPLIFPSSPSDVASQSSPSMPSSPSPPKSSIQSPLNTRFDPTSKDSITYKIGSESNTRNLRITMDTINHGASAPPTSTPSLPTLNDLTEKHSVSHKRIPPQKLKAAERKREKDRLTAAEQNCTGVTFQTRTTTKIKSSGSTSDRPSSRLPSATPLNTRIPSESSTDEGQKNPSPFSWDSLMVTTYGDKSASTISHSYGGPNISNSSEEKDLPVSTTNNQSCALNIAQDSEEEGPTATPAQKEGRARAFRVDPKVMRPGTARRSLGHRR